MQTARQITPLPLRSRPPFRAQHVGSLLRPQYLAHARACFRDGLTGSERLREFEDKAVLAAVRRQESLGFENVTDGEMRRSYFHLDFLEKIEGITVAGRIAASSDAGKTLGFTPPRITVTGRLRHRRPIETGAFRVLRSFTGAVPRVTIPSPSMAHFRGGRAAIAADVYPDLDECFADLAACYRAEIEALYAAGCRHIQLDDTNLAYLCDPKMREEALRRGDDPDTLAHTYAELINDAIRTGHDDLHFGIHLCRGNYRSTWFSEGGYAPVAEVLFNELDTDSYFLEYDDARSGGFEPLRYVPDGKHVVLGLVSSKAAALEDKRAIIRRIEEAAAHVPLDNLSVSPQCGFASTHHGNDLSESQQWAKLALVKEIADEVWRE